MTGETPPRDERVFVGRARELQAFDAALTEARAGRGQLLLLTGEPGIGKTRVAAECAARAQAEGVRVLWGRAWEGDGAPAFWPWIQVVRAYLRDADPSTLTTDLGRAGAEIARVMPELEALLPGESRVASSATLGLQPEQERFRFFDGLTLFLKAASRRQPLLLVLDDLQWADTPSLLLWQFVTQELADSHLLVMGTYRESELDPEHPLFQILGAVRREPVCRQMTLRGLEPPEIGHYVTALSKQAPSGELVTALAERTEGNPFFLRELVQLLMADGSLHRTDAAQRWRDSIPIGIRQVIGRRVAGLPVECRHLLSLASAIGREFDIELLSAVAAAELGEPDETPQRRTRHTLATVEPAVAAGLLQGDTGRRYAFTHAMIRETLYAELTPATRPWLHRRIGEAMEAQRLPAPPSELAHHFSLADVSGKAWVYARQAGDRALAALAYEDAAAHYRRALEVVARDPDPDQRVRCELLLALEEAEMRGGNVERGRATSLQAAAVARTVRDAELFARAALGFGWHFRAGVVDDERIDLLKNALDGLSAGDSTLRARLMARLAVALYFVDGSYEWRAVLSAEAVTMARRISDTATIAFTLNARLYALWGPDDTAARLQLAGELLRLAHTCGDRELSLQSRHWLVMDLIESGQIEAARVHIVAHAELAEQLRQPVYLWFAEKWRASLLLMEGRLSEAEAWNLRAYEIGQRAERGNAETTFATQQFISGLERGELEAVADVAAAWELAGSFEAAQACGRALLFTEAGRFEALRRELQYLTRLGTEKIPRDAGWLAAVTLAGVAVAHAQDLPLASSLYEHLLPFADRVALAGMLDGCFGSVSRSLGLLATALGRYADAAHHFADAFAMHERMRARPLIARTQHDWAAMLLRRREPGDVERALPLLDAALATARELGMKSLEQKAATLRDRVIEGSRDRVEPENGRRESGRAEGEPESGTRNQEPGTRDQQPGTRDPGPAPSVFRRSGDMWTITFDGTTVQLRDTRGLQYLVRLLTQPTRELHATALIGLAPGASSSSLRAADAQVIAADLGDAGAVLDAEATAQYQRRLAELREDLIEAERDNDLGRTAHLREELAFLSQQLASAGRGRRVASHAERARVTVAKGITAAMKKIAAAHPALGRHLKATVRTGYFCSYSPDPRLRIEWLGAILWMVLSTSDLLDPLCDILAG